MIQSFKCLGELFLSLCDVDIDNHGAFSISNIFGNSVNIFILEIFLDNSRITERGH